MLKVQIEYSYPNTSKEEIPHYNLFSIEGHATNVGVNVGEPSRLHEEICASITCVCTAFYNSISLSLESQKSLKSTNKSLTLEKGLFLFKTDKKVYDEETDIRLDMILQVLWFLHKEYPSYFSVFSIKERKLNPHG